MLDFVEARTNMVNCQLRTNDITDTRVIRAMNRIPREHFIPEEKSDLAYVDNNVLIAGTLHQDPRYLMSPVTMGRLLQMADIGASDIVLDIGCMTGYSSAIIAQLGSYVVGIDNDQTLVDQAVANLSELEVNNVSIFQSELKTGHDDQKEYDVIFLNGSFESIPQDLFDLMGEGARLVGIKGTGAAATACLYTKRNDIVSNWISFNASISALSGFEADAQFSL